MVDPQFWIARLGSPHSRTFVVDETFNRSASAQNGSYLVAIQALEDHQGGEERQNAHTSRPRGHLLRQSQAPLLPPREQLRSLAHPPLTAGRLRVRDLGAPERRQVGPDEIRALRSAPAFW